MDKSFYNWQYWFMKVKIGTATKEEIAEARQTILKHVLYTKTISVDCIKECVTSYAFLYLYESKDANNVKQFECYMVCRHVRTQNCCPRAGRFRGV